MNGTPNLPNQQAIDMMQQTFNNKDSGKGLAVLLAFHAQARRPSGPKLPTIMIGDC
ncbi:MAG: hypothetical protein CM15mP120_19550 [Pseudomonadota bacterium]|nr:MAG: hypothetical protein CM15mP120_19550 [Pseudomonadota bacterium]